MSRLRRLVVELGNTSDPAADYCLVYNYYASGANPTACAVPAQTTGDNGNAMGFLYQDNVNASLSHTETYAYDSLNRLTNAQATGSVSYDLPFSYTVDGSDGRYGNVTCVINGNTSGLCPTYSFNSANNRITNSGYTYDAAGDLTSDGTYTYQYDAEGRLNNVTDGGNPFASLTYNVGGQMVSLLYQAYGNEVVVGVFSPAGRELGYYDGVAGTWYDRDVWAAGRMVAQSFPATFKGGLTQFLHANALGSDSQITIQTGASAYDILYYPWGQYWSHVGSQGDSHFARFQQTSGVSSTGTPTRRYSMNEGRWMTPDPAGLAAIDLMNPQSWNAYAYALNNPTTNTDPTGLYCTRDSKGNWVDVGTSGESCADVEASNAAEEKNPSTNVTGQPGNVAEAVGANIGIGLSNLMIGNANAFYSTVTVGQYSPNLPQIPAGSGIAANIGAIAPLVGMALIGPEGEAAEGADAAAETVSRVEGRAPTEGQTAHVSLILAQGGRASLEKSLNSWEKLLAEHEAKLRSFEQAGGYTSYVEKEISDFQGLIQAAKNALGGQP